MNIIEIIIVFDNYQSLDSTHGKLSSSVSSNILRLMLDTVFPSSASTQRLTNSFNKRRVKVDIIPKVVVSLDILKATCQAQSDLHQKPSFQTTPTLHLSNFLTSHVSMVNIDLSDMDSPPSVSSTQDKNRPLGDNIKIGYRTKALDTNCCKKM